MDTWTAAELQATSFPAPMVDDLVDLVDSGQCTPQCLFGGERSECGCRCGERYHGLARSTGPRLMPHPDCCPSCLATLAMDPPTPSGVLFGSVEHWRMDDGMVVATYRCPHCHESWNARWDRTTLVPTEVHAEIMRMDRAGEL